MKKIRFQLPHIYDSGCKCCVYSPNNKETWDVLVHDGNKLHSQLMNMLNSEFSLLRMEITND